MDIENQPTNRERENNEPQLSPPKESIPSSGDQNNRPESPETEGSSPPEEVNAPGILRTLFAERRRISSSLDKGLTKIEEFIEMNARFFSGEDESKNQ